MEPLARRLLVVGAIAVAGIGAGLALGSFVAGVPERGRAQAVAGVDTATVPAGQANDQTALTPLHDAAPQRYSCQGCDAGLHNDMIPGNAGDLAPLPPYSPEEHVLMPPPDTGPVAPAPSPAPPLKLPSDPGVSRPKTAD